MKNYEIYIYLFISNQCVNERMQIKTTSPDRFRVRPTSGLLQPGVTAKITVVLQSGYQIQSIFIDKFLIMAMITEKEEATPSEIAEIWKVIKEYMYNFAI